MFAVRVQPRNHPNLRDTATSPRNAIHKFHSSFCIKQIMPFISRLRALGISIANTAAE